MIPHGKVLPTILILIDLGAAIPYFADGNWRRGRGIWSLLLFRRRERKFLEYDPA